MVSSREEWDGLRLALKRLLWGVKIWNQILNWC